jgi:hypothetical protein
MCATCHSISFASIVNGEPEQFLRTWRDLVLDVREVQGKAWIQIKINGEKQISECSGKKWVR